MIYNMWAEPRLEGFYERIMAQMSVGEGLDLLYVHGEDMNRLSARGLLADLGKGPGAMENCILADLAGQSIYGIMCKMLRI